MNVNPPPQHYVNRCGSVDSLKTLAIVSVVVLHVSVFSYQAAVPVFSFDWLCAVGWGCVSRAGVPIFFMCSGALLLDPDRDLGLKKLYGKNLLHILTALLFWACAYKVYRLADAGLLSGPWLWQSFKDVLFFKHEEHLYYLHILLLVYAFLPVTRLLAAHGEKRRLEYALALWFVLGIVYPTLRSFWPLSLLSGIPAQWALNLTYTSVGYGLMGWYLRAYAKRWKPWALLAAAGTAEIFAATVLGSFRLGKFYAAQLNDNTVGVALMAVGICGAFFAAAGERPAPKLVLRLCQAGFCIFLCHIFLLDIVHSLPLFPPSLPALVSIPLEAALVLAGGLAVHGLLSRVPFVSRWIV